MCRASSEGISFPGPMGSSWTWRRRWTRTRIRRRRRTRTRSLGLQHRGRANDQKQNEQYTGIMQTTHLVFPSGKDFHHIPLCRSCATSSEIVRILAGLGLSNFPYSNTLKRLRTSRPPWRTRLGQVKDGVVVTNRRNWHTLVRIEQTQQIYGRAVRTITFHDRSQHGRDNSGQETVVCSDVMQHEIAIRVDDPVTESGRHNESIE